jgi:putative hemin transport protein
VEKLGKVMALTRNEACVHEKKGVYHHSSVNGQTGLVLAGDIDLRIFISTGTAALRCAKL